MNSLRGHRSSTTPMDFEYDNRTGPVETNSPFLNIAAKKRKHTHTPAFSFDRRDEDWLTPGPSGQPGPHSFLESPSRNGFATPNRLREPDSRHFYFSAQTTDKPLPVPPHVQNSSAWEPRTPNSTFDFSSGGETPNTPHVDSDVATPETQLADRMTHLTSGDSPSPKKGGRRESLFKRLNPFTASPSPTKERDKDDARKYYSHKAEHRIQKRRSERSERSERSRSKKKAVVRDNGGDDSDTEPTNTRLAPPQQQGQLQQTYATSIGGFLHWIEAHPALPSVLSFYMQLLVNVFLASMFIYIMYAAWSGVMADVDIESSKHMSVIMVEMATCAKDFSANRCDNAVPHVQKLCDAWETCMSRDPRKVARASVTAKTFAKIFNSFVEEFSYKSMVFTAIIIFGGFHLSNWAFGFLRASTQQQQHPPPQNEYVPQTPQRALSNGYSDQAYLQNYTPYNHTPYNVSAMNRIEAPPLVHAQSMPALPTLDNPIVGDGEEARTGRKRGLWR